MPTKIGRLLMVQQESGLVIRDQPAPRSQSGGEGGGGDGAFITNLRRRKVDTYAVTEDELTSIGTQYRQANSLFSLASITFGAMLSAFLSSKEAPNWPVLLILTFAALAFLGMGIWVHLTRKTLLQRIKDQTTAPDK